MAQLRQLIDQSQEAKTREQLEFLLVAAKGKLANFEGQLNLMYLNPESQGKIQIIGDRALELYKEYRANITKGVDEQISSIIDDFFTGAAPGIKSGFQNLIKVGLKTILGSESAGELEQDYFTVLPVGLSFLRIDVKAWRYNFSSEGVISTAKNAFAFLMAKSIVDYKKLSPGEMIYFVQQVVGSDTDKIKEIIQAIKELYELLGDKEPPGPPRLPTRLYER